MTRPIPSPVAGLPPGPRTPAVVQTYRYVRNPLPLLDECATRFGDMFTIRLVGTAPWVFIWSPSLLKALFAAPADVVHAGEANATVFGAIAGSASVFTMDESAHLNRRRLLLPQFHGDRMQVYFDQIRDIAMQAVARWQPEAPFAMNQETRALYSWTGGHGARGDVWCGLSVARTLRSTARSRSVEPQAT